MTDDQVTHLVGAEASLVGVRLAAHALREASSGYLALASDPDRRIYTDSAVQAFDAVSKAISAVIKAEDALREHECKVAS